MISMGKPRRLRLKKRTSINSNSQFHKEKEMADFRKWFLAFALVALLLGAGTASAQNPAPQQAFTCVANAGTPLIVRVEGITELVGDLLLQCQGGQPTPAGTPVLTTNLRLSLNTNVTSRLLGSGFIDALLLIDEPFPGTTVTTAPTTAQTHPGTSDANVPSIFAPPTIPLNSPTQKVCAVAAQPLPTDCNFLKGTFNGGLGGSTAYGGPNSPYLPGPQAAVTGTVGGPSTVYVGRQVSASAVEWDGCRSILRALRASASSA
jgi:hypothetical protein